MCLFKKKKASDKVAENRELVAFNSKSIDGLIVLAGDREELVESLKDLREKLKFLIPSDKPKVMDYDKTVKNKIGDLKIALIKADGDASKKVDDLIRDINLTVADRNAIL